MRKLIMLALCLALSLPALAFANNTANKERYEDTLAYQGQNSCDPRAKPGTVAVSQLLMRKYGGGSSGIVRSCSVGSVSEHKEGRAFDWRLNAHNAKDRARAKKAITWLTKEQYGIEAYNAKRLGIMYMIWNRKMWRGYDIDRGWEKYTGSSPHTDHMHLSLTWAGAMKNSSYWTSDAFFDYGPCQKWENRPASKWKKPRLTPCATPLKYPVAKNGRYRAQENETVARIARFFSKDKAKIRRWNNWPQEGKVSIEVGQRVWVQRH